MPRTSTLKATAAALGLLSGFVMAPEGQAPLDRDVTPYSVAVVWRTSGPPELPSVSGLQMDDWGGRLAPAPAPAPVRRAAPKAAAPRTPARAAKRSPAPAVARTGEKRPERPVLRGSELAAATFGTLERACPREDAHAHRAHAITES